MKKFISTVLIVSLLSLTACTNSTEYGECIGINDQENPALHYKYSAWNIALAIIFSETIFVPLIVIFDDLKCPEGPRKSWQKQ